MPLCSCAIHPRVLACPLVLIELTRSQEKNPTPLYSLVRRWIYQDVDKDSALNGCDAGMHFLFFILGSSSWCRSTSTAMALSRGENLQRLRTRMK